MNKLLVAMLIALPLVATPTLAEEKKENPQHARMKACNQEAGDKKGPERKAFMSQCLKDKKKAQNEKMKACNEEAKDKKGAERKAFMKECMSK